MWGFFSACGTRRHICHIRATVLNCSVRVVCSGGTLMSLCIQSKDYFCLMESKKKLTGTVYWAEFIGHIKIKKWLLLAQIKMARVAFQGETIQHLQKWVFMSCSFGDWTGWMKRRHSHSAFIRGNFIPMKSFFDAYTIYFDIFVFLWPWKGCFPQVVRHCCRGSLNFELNTEMPKRRGECSHPICHNLKRSLHLTLVISIFFFLLVIFWNN